MLAILALPAVAQAGPGWDAFVARCLDPFEHQSLPIVDGLDAQPADSMHEARRVFAGHDFVLFLDAAPTEGERACAVEPAHKGDDPMARDWVTVQLAKGRYVQDAGWLVSHEWIEPRVMVQIEAGTFRVVETDLES